MRALLYSANGVVAKRILPCIDAMHGAVLQPTVLVPVGDDASAALPSAKSRSDPAVDVRQKERVDGSSCAIALHCTDFAAGAT